MELGLSLRTLAQNDQMRRGEITIGGSRTIEYTL